MSIKWLYIAFGIFTVLVIIAAFVTLRFNPSSMDFYTFIDRYFSQWSNPLVAVGTILLASVTFLSLRESRLKEKHQEDLRNQQLVRALYDELHYNMGKLNEIISTDEENHMIETSKGVVS